MNELEIIYQNEFGISFYWKNRTEKIQVVFREIGFHLNIYELKNFRGKVIASLAQNCCQNCQTSQTCRSLLLKTPSENIDLAVNREELTLLNDLLGTTIHKLELQDYLNNMCWN